MIGRKLYGYLCCEIGLEFCSVELVYFYICFAFVIFADRTS